MLPNPLGRTVMFTPSPAPSCRWNRGRASGGDAAGPTQSSGQHGLRPLLCDSSGKEGGDAGLFRGYPRPDGVGTLDRNGGGGQWTPGGVALPRLLADGEAQVRKCVCECVRVLGVLCVCACIWCVVGFVPSCTPRGLYAYNSVITTRSDHLEAIRARRRKVFVAILCLQFACMSEVGMSS